MPPNRMHLEECRLRDKLSFKALFELENGIDEMCIVCNLDVKKRPSTFTSELGYASSTPDFLSCLHPSSQPSGIICCVVSGEGFFRSLSRAQADLRGERVIQSQVPKVVGSCRIGFIRIKRVVHIFLFSWFHYSIQ